MKLGVIIPLTPSFGEETGKVQSLHLPSCQVNAWDPSLFTEDMARTFREAVDTSGIEVTALWVGWPGPAVWDFIDGPVTLGLVPPSFQWARVQALRAGSDFAKEVGVDTVVTHVGFIPEDPNDGRYRQLLVALRDIAGHCRRNGQYFLFETGQETPTTLLRTVEDLGLDNLGVNLDPANLLMYGKANPVDSLDVFGHLVRGVHAKDGEYPTTGRSLGPERPLGEGRVDFPRLVARLRELGYDGALTIEREISGPEQARDIERARDYLSKLLAY